MAGLAPPGSATDNYQSDSLSAQTHELTATANYRLQNKIKTPCTVFAKWSMMADVSGIMSRWA